MQLEYDKIRTQTADFLAVDQSPGQPGDFQPSCIPIPHFRDIALGAPHFQDRAKTSTLGLDNVLRSDHVQFADFTNAYVGRQDFDSEAVVELAMDTMHHPAVRFEGPISSDMISLGLEEPLPVREVSAELYVHCFTLE